MLYMINTTQFNLNRKLHRRTHSAAIVCALLAVPIAQVSRSVERDSHATKMHEAGATAGTEQTPSSEKEVRGILQTYIDATRTGDAQRARTLFHADARMSGQIDAGDVHVGTPEPFFKALESHPSASTEGHPYTASIGAISVQGGTATAVISEKNLYGYDFTDHFHLIRSDGRWQIISKLFRGSAIAKQTSAPQGAPK
jgi:hypothetical protein